MNYEKRIDSPIGTLTLNSDGDAVTAGRFGDQWEGGASCPVLEQAAVQLREYFDGRRCSFSVPLRPMGTEFQRRVWEALQSIPYGETMSYADIAYKIGKPTACRAVGGANNRNPLPIFIPCHRVIGKDGRLVGYYGGLSAKEILLALEREVCIKCRNTV